MGRPKGSVNKIIVNQTPSKFDVPADVPRVQTVTEPSEMAIPVVSPHDQCLFSKEGSRFFHSGEEIPAGFRDTPYMEDEK